MQHLDTLLINATIRTPQKSSWSRNANPCTSPAACRVVGSSATTFTVANCATDSAMPDMQQRGSLLSAVASSSITQPRPQDIDPHQATSIPPWVHVNEGEEEQESKEQDALLSTPSPRARPNTRHYRPSHPHHYKPGRKWDSLRSAEPALLSEPIAEHQQRWKPFMQSGPNPQTRGGRVVDAAWMDEHMPDLNPDWHPDDEAEVGTGPQGFTAKGLMYKGMWLISPERQEKSIRFFWVSVCLEKNTLEQMTDGASPATTA
jgi:hypothetical protein